MFVDTLCNCAVRTTQRLTDPATRPSGINDVTSDTATTTTTSTTASDIDDDDTDTGTCLATSSIYTADSVRITIMYSVSQKNCL